MADKTNIERVGTEYVKLDSIQQAIISSMANMMFALLTSIANIQNANTNQEGKDHA